jgi:hypothetical protein
MRLIGNSGNRDELKLNTLGCIIVPSALFIALMISTAGVAIWPQVAAPGAAILCGSGEVVYESHGASYRPGEYTVSREIYCQTGTGKGAPREEITFSAMGVSFPIYALIAFLLLQFVVRPLLARKLRRKMEALGIGGSVQSGWPGTPAAAVNLNDILSRVQEAVQRGEADVQVRNVSVDPGGAEPGGGDIAARLAQLKALRDRGLITGQDYEAKKAEILAGL